MDVSPALADMIRASLNTSISRGHSGADAAAALVHAMKSWREPAPLGLASAQPDAAGLAAADRMHHAPVLQAPPQPAPAQWPNQTHPPQPAVPVAYQPGADPPLLPYPAPVNAPVDRPRQPAGFVPATPVTARPAPQPTQTTPAPALPNVTQPKADPSPDPAPVAPAKSPS